MVAEGRAPFARLITGGKIEQAYGDSLRFKFLSQWRQEAPVWADGGWRVIRLRMPTKKTKGKWVVYERRLVGPKYEGEIVYVSKFFATRGQAEKERKKLQGTPEYEKRSLGVGFVRG